MQFCVIASAFVTSHLEAESPADAMRLLHEWRDRHPEVPIPGGEVLILSEPLPSLFGSDGQLIGRFHQGRIVGQ